MEVLYLSYDGMTDQLGQSQVIPYLQGLSESGYKITLISFEKRIPYKTDRILISNLLKKSEIDWIPMEYTKWPPVFSTLWDIFRLRNTVRSLLKHKQFKIVHCRSYITALTGLQLKKKQGLRFIFDMRGFWVDERVEGKIWNLKNPFYKLVYTYFKNKEKQFFMAADQVISLTLNAKTVIENWNLKGTEIIPIEVIPCCADLEHFNRTAISEQKKKEWKEKLNFKTDDLVISYLGAIGTWYMLDEMLDFFKCCSEKSTHLKFLFITREPEKIILEAAKKKNIPAQKIVVTPSSRSELPVLLSLSHLSVFFIRPSFSKKASSPTKQGEIMGMGIPIICNSGVGDTDSIITSTQAGKIISEFTRENYMEIATNLDALLTSDHERIRAGAEKYYSLKSGIESYKRIYKKLEN